MSAMTLINRLMNVLQAGNWNKLCKLSGFTPPEISKIRAGVHAGDLKFSTLVRVHHQTDIPIGLLAEWLAEPDDADITKPVHASWTKRKDVVIHQHIDNLWQYMIHAKKKENADDKAVLSGQELPD